MLSFDDVKAAINNSILGYLRGREDARPYTTTREVQVMQHGAVLKGEFVGCLVTHPTLPPGTEGFVFEHRRITYSAYVRVGDQDWPAKGANILYHGSSWSFVTLLDVAGHRVLADAMVEGPRLEQPRVIGKV